MSKGKLVSGAEWIESNLLPISQQLGPVLLAIMAVWIGIWYPDAQAAYKDLTEKSFTYWLWQWTPWLFLIISAVSIYGGIGGTTEGRRKDRLIEQLKGELLTVPPLRDGLEEAQQTIDYLRIQQEELIFKATSEYLGHLSNDHLSFNDSERVSLYLHDDGHERFILAGRYSKNPEFSKIHRKAFPDSQGCIGQTWKNGGQYFAELPQIEEEYLEYLKTNLSIDRKSAKSLRMKSTAYCSFALEENYRRTGILLFESLKHGVLKKDSLQQIASEHEAYLKEMLKKTRDVNSLIAHQAGSDNHV